MPLEQSAVAALASTVGTAAYAARFPGLAPSYHFRKLRLPEPLQVSSLGLGTYLGEADEATDASYVAAVSAALDGGINLFDTAINYRHQRSERALGRALRVSGLPRDQVVICTKAGYLPFDATLPRDPAAYMRDAYLRSGLIRPGELVQDCHCMAPVYLADQLRRSLENLGVDAVDVLYIHNPETQQAVLSREEFYRRLRLAFEFLEKQAAAGRLRAYGVATWSGFRVPPDAKDFLDLQRMVATARELAGDQHHFRFIQLPYNLAMPEAYTLLNQTVDKPPYVSTLNAAYRLGLHAIASASLRQGSLASLPPDTRDYLTGFFPGTASDNEIALQFARSTTGVTSALVGMSSPLHVAANLKVAALPPPPPATVGRLLGQ